MMKAVILPTIFSLIGVMSLTACQRPTQTTEQPPTPTTTQTQTTTPTSETPVYNVYTELNLAPFVSRDAQGQATGFDIDVLNAIAESQQFQVKYEPLPWEQVLAGMQEGKADLAAAAIIMTEDRKKQFKFSKPYFESRQAVLAKQKFADKKSFTGLKGANIAVLEKSAGEAVMQKYDVNLQRYKVLFRMIKDLENGSVDGVAFDDGVLEYYKNQVLKNKDFVIIHDESIPTETYGFIVNANNDELLKKVNAGLTTIQQNGKYQQIQQKWFGN